MIPSTIWNASGISAQPLGSGPHRVLMNLWDYAHKWQQGDAEAFVWPSVDTLAARIGIGVRAVYASLATLEAEGCIRRARDAARGVIGWVLSAVRAAAVACVELEHEPELDDAQLAFAWALDEVKPEPSSTPVPECTPVHCRPVDLCTATSTEQNLNVVRDDDDAGRIWSGYEAHRIRALASSGARATRTGPAPKALRNLHASLGGTPDAWQRIEAYGRRSIELAALAVAQGRTSAPMLVACRADGREWSRDRFDAVMAWGNARTSAPAAPPMHRANCSP